MIGIKSYSIDEGYEIKGYILTTPSGMSVEILNLGGIIRSIYLPDRQGNSENVVMSFEKIEDYIKNPGYTNAVIGRMAGRIGDGRLFLNGEWVQLTQNEGSNQLHGGHMGLDKKIWDVEVVEGVEETRLVLKTQSAHMEEGYPGNVQVKVTYTLSTDQKLKIEYEGTTDTATVMNLTNHAYFNLSGNLKTTILEHEVQISAKSYAAIDEASIVTGDLIDVEGSAFDFNMPIAIGARIANQEAQLAMGKGYDHPWCLNHTSNQPQITCYDPKSGRKLEITTDQEAVVMYTMNYPIEVVKAGSNYPLDTTRLGVCFETQALPMGYNGVNQSKVMIDPDHPYKQTTLWHFKCE